MTYKEFCTEFTKRIVTDKRWEIGEENVTFYEDGYTAQGDAEETAFIRNTNLKYHHVEKDVLIGDYVAVQIGERCGVQSMSRFSMEYLYHEFEYDGWERVWAIVDYNMKLSRQPDGEPILAHILEFDYIKERLIIRPINFTDNRFELKNCIYKQIGDMALVLYVLLYDNQSVGVGTTKVQKNVFEQWGKELDEVWNLALHNTNVMAPPRMYMNLLECLKADPDKGIFMERKEKIELEHMDVPTVTTTRQMNGAIAMFYPNVKEKLAQLFDADYYVAFTSVNDARIHPVGTLAPRQILNCLKSVNQSFPEDEILTRKVYYYDREKKTLEVVEL